MMALSRKEKVVMSATTEYVPSTAEKVVVDIPVSIGNRAFNFQIHEGEDAQTATETFVGTIRSSLDAEIRRNLPIIVPVILQGENDGDEANTVELIMKAQDSISQKVDAFMSEHQLADKVRHTLESKVAEQLLQMGIGPLIEVPLMLDEEEVIMPLFANDPLQFSINLFVMQKGLNQESAELLAREASSRLSQTGVLPIAELDIALRKRRVDGSYDEGDAPQVKKLYMYVNDTIAGAVSRFMKRERILDNDGSVTNSLIIRVNEEGIRLGFIPVAEVPVFVDSQQVQLPLFSNIEVSKSVESFALKHGVSDEQKELLQQGVMSHLRQEGLAPIIEIPVSIILDPSHPAAMSASDPRGDEREKEVHQVQFPLYTKQDVDEQVDLFFTSNKLDSSSMDINSFRVEVKQRLIASGMLPRAVFPINVDGVNLSMDLYEGESLVNAAASFIKKHSLDESLTSSLVEQLEFKYGVVSVPIAVGNDEGSEHNKIEFITLRHGENSEDIVREFCKRHGVTDQKSIEELQAGLRARLYTQKP